MCNCILKNRKVSGVVLLGSLTASLASHVAQNNCVAWYDEYVNPFQDDFFDGREKDDEEEKLRLYYGMFFVGCWLLLLLCVGVKVYRDDKKLKDGYKKYLAIKKNTEGRTLTLGEYDYCLRIHEKLYEKYSSKEYSHLFGNKKWLPFKNENLVGREEDFLLFSNYAIYVDETKEIGCRTYSFDEYKKISEHIGDDFEVPPEKIAGREHFILNVLGNKKLIDENWKKCGGLFSGKIYYNTKDKDFKEDEGYRTIYYYEDSKPYHTQANMVTRKDISLRDAMLRDNEVKGEVVEKLFKKYLYWLHKHNLCATEVYIDFEGYCRFNISEDSNIIGLEDRKQIKRFLEEKDKFKESYNMTSYCEET